MAAYSKAPQEQMDVRPAPELHEARKRPEHGSRFVVQLHGSGRPHFDFGLEHDGMLLSWSILKGPSLDPSTERVAVETAPQPMDYGTFEGVIPEGQSGAGPVLLWDRGVWIPQGDVLDGLEQGTLVFELEGEKLRGRWHLMRRPAQDSKRAAWLLTKERDDDARTGTEAEVSERRPNSVLSGRSLEEVALEPERIWRENEQDPVVHPRSIANGERRPLLEEPPPARARRASTVPDGDEWLHEIELRGLRTFVRIADGHARLTGDGAEELVDAGMWRALDWLRVEDALLDGVLAVVDPDGVTRAEGLERARRGEARVHLFLFDLLHLDGYDLRGAPLSARKRALKRMLQDAGITQGRVRFVEHVVGGGAELLSAGCDLGIPGVVSKKADSVYESGPSTGWVRVPCMEHEGRFEHV